MIGITTVGPNLHSGKHDESQCGSRRTQVAGEENRKCRSVLHRRSGGQQIEYIDGYPDRVLQLINLPTEVDPEEAVFELHAGILKFDSRKLQSVPWKAWLRQLESSSSPPSGARLVFGRRFDIFQFLHAMQEHVNGEQSKY